MRRGASPAVVVDRAASRARARAHGDRLRLRLARPATAPCRIAFRRWRLGAFLAGLGTVFVAIASPLDAFADRRSLLCTWRSICCSSWSRRRCSLLGAPRRAAAARPAARVAFALGPFLAWPDLRLARTRSAIRSSVWRRCRLATWGWHVPRRSSSRCARRRGTSSSTRASSARGCCSGGPSSQPWPSRPRWPRWAMIPYLLLADVQNTAARRAARVLGSRALSELRAIGGSPLDDQAAAGVLMWVPMSVVYLVPAAVLTVRFLAPRAHYSIRSSNCSAWRPRASSRPRVTAAADPL